MYEERTAMDARSVMSEGKKKDTIHFVESRHTLPHRDDIEDSLKISVEVKMVEELIEGTLGGLNLACLRQRHLVFFVVS